MNKPLLICMTPVRNEAWVLNAFLKATSLWADYIIIADQNSTDGSREIALNYPKVILIDNFNTNFNEAERQKLLIDKAREIEGDKILFGLDADEVFSANFNETKDWERVLKSKQGDVFWFQWANISSTQKEYWSPKTYYPWMFHDDGVELHGNYVRNMHSMRIPYPIEESQLYYVNDFKVLHLAYLNSKRVDAKNRFYKFVDYELNKKSCVSLSRSYKNNLLREEIIPLPVEWIYNKDKHRFDLFKSIECDISQFWFDNYIIERIENNSAGLYKNLDIWDNTFLKEYNLNDPRTIWMKLVHEYLKLTENNTENFLIRTIDKFLKRIGL